jgi:hypothetical protein
MTSSVHGVRGTHEGEKEGKGGIPQGFRMGEKITKTRGTN